MRYENIDALDKKLESLISRKVKSYYSDWKNYDRPKYMCFKGSSDRKDKDFLVLIRRCGTYIIRTCDIFVSDVATTLFEYYHTQDRSDYYYVNLEKLELKKIKDPVAFGKTLRSSLRS